MMTPIVKIAFPDFPSGEIALKVNETSSLNSEVSIDGSVVTPTNYSYEVFNTDGVTPNTSTLQVSGTVNPVTITGVAVGAAKIKLTVTLTYNGSSLSASSYVVVGVVSTATDALMSMTDAYKLFGWVDSYFSIPTGDKRTIFQIRETNDIYQATCTATSHLRLKVSKEIILGDSISFTVTRGNTFSVSVNLNDKSDKPDTSMKGNGVTNISMIGVASKLEIEAFAAHEDDYYSYDKSLFTGTNTGTNYVYIPRLKVLNLDYGKITWFRRDRAISLEFMGPKKYGGLAPNETDYANYSEIQEDQFRPISINTSYHRPDDRYLLPEENNLGLLNEYFLSTRDDASSCMPGYSTIDLPPNLLADHTLDTGGANILQFMHGKGRLAYDYMDGAMKTFLKTRDSNILMYVGPIVTESVACAAFVKLEYYAFMITNQVISPWHFNTDVFLWQANITRSVCKIGCDFTSLTQNYDCVNAFHASALEFGAEVCSTKLGTFVKKADVFCFEENMLNLTNGLVGACSSVCSVTSTSFFAAAQELGTQMGVLSGEGGELHIHI